MLLFQIQHDLSRYEAYRKSFSTSYFEIVQGV